MNRRNLVGVALCGALFIASFVLTGAWAAYFNLAAFLVVFSGLGAALLLSYPTERIAQAFRVARGAYTRRPAQPERIVRTLLDLSVRSRVDGVLSLDKMSEQATSSFLRNGIQFLVDNYSEAEIREFLDGEMAFFQLRRRQSERVFQTLARMAPAFGVAGSVIGLIGLLMGISDTAIILKSIPVAFISTLYGVILGNMVFAPVAENIHFTTGLELINQKLMAEAVIAIRKEQNPYKLERRLASFLTPKDREGQTEALRGITRKYLKQKRAEKQAREAEEGEPLKAVSFGKVS